MATPVESDGGVPPAGEQVHLPGPSYLPIWLAFGVALAICGIVITPVLTAIGVVIFVWTAARWIRETRAEISDLPLEHRH